LAESEIDARALACPLPVIMLAKAAAVAADGDLITVWCTDPAARIDIPAWARMTGNTIESGPETTTDGPAYAVTVRCSKTAAS